MQRVPLRRGLALGAVLSVVFTGGAYAAGSALAGQSRGAEHRTDPVEEVPAAVPTSAPTPNGPAALPEQASDRASQAIAERGRAAHAQGPKADETTEAADPTEDAEVGPGYGPGVHAGPHGDFGPDNHPSGDDHPDGTITPDTTNHPGTDVDHPGPGDHGQG